MPWPEVPNSLQEPAPDLKALPENKKTLTDLIENVNENYGSYYELKEKYEAWQDWYKTQKKIYESIK
jgi:hypothetical protein